MELTFLGLGGAFTTKLGSNMAYYKNGKDLLLIDCGEGCLKQFQTHNLFDGVENIYVAITHNHADHIAGLANMIWYNFLANNQKIHIIENTPAHAEKIKEILTLCGVDSTFYDFIPYPNFNINGLALTPIPTIHAPDLDCFSFLLEDSEGKYFYTGDTKDFEQVKSYVNNPEIKLVYTEVADVPNVAHIQFDDLKTLDKNKIRLMHFTGSLDLYEKAISEGFKLPKNLVFK
ncbi:MAG: MBL fold metallo-hydrolase [Clostridia bacterium]|nr:MBL fold metallo-hydrolase [Clostridia bacterium]